MSYPLPPNESKRLAALRHYQIMDTGPEQAYDDFVYLASTICRTPVALMSLVDAERQWFKAKVGLPVAETPREQAFCSYTILQQEVMVVKDATKDERFSTNPLVTSIPHIRFYAGAPLIDSEGMAMGSLCVIDRKPRTFTDEQAKSLKALARQIMAHMEMRKISAELATALGEIKTLNGLLPICSYCKEIRNDHGYWQSVESYVSCHSEARFTHGFCPSCIQERFPDVYEQLKNEGEM
ncbi:MAG: GAF domain-containing protein [Chthoniobacteraceae bacterium]